MTCEVWGFPGWKRRARALVTCCAEAGRGFPPRGVCWPSVPGDTWPCFPARMEGGLPHRCHEGTRPCRFCPLPQTEASHRLLWPRDISRCWILQTLEKPPVVHVTQPVKGVTTPACRDACSVIDDAGLCVPFSLTCFLFAPL